MGQLAWYGRDGKRRAAIGKPAAYTSLRLSPDDKSAVRCVLPVWSKNSICLNPIMVAGRTGYPGKAFQNGSNTTLYGPQLTCNVSSQPFGAWGHHPWIQHVRVFLPYGHTTAVFLSQTRSWERWNDVFADMTQRGANGTDEQLA